MIGVHLTDCRARLADGVLRRDDVFAGQLDRLAVVDEQRAERKALHNTLVDILLSFARGIGAARQGDKRSVAHDKQLVAGGSLIAIKHAVADDKPVLVLVVVIIAVERQNRIVAFGNRAGRFRVVLGILLAGKRGMQLRRIIHIDIGDEKAQARAVKSIAPAVNRNPDGIALVRGGFLDGLGIGFGRCHGVCRHAEHKDERKDRKQFFHK